MVSIFGFVLAEMFSDLIFIFISQFCRNMRQNLMLPAIIKQKKLCYFPKIHGDFPICGYVDFLTSASNKVSKEFEQILRIENVSCIQEGNRAYIIIIFEFSQFIEITHAYVNLVNSNQNRKG